MIFDVYHYNANILTAAIVEWLVGPMAGQHENDEDDKAENENTIVDNAQNETQSWKTVEWWFDGTITIASSLLCDGSRGPHLDFTWADQSVFCVFSPSSGATHCIHTDAVNANENKLGQGLGAN